MEHISRSCFEALKKQDQEASKTAYLHYLPFARHVVHRCGVHDMRQDDIIQSGFLKLFQNIEKLEGPNSLAQWLAVTLRNLCFDEFRKETRARRQVIEMMDSTETDSHLNAEVDAESQLFEGRLHAEAIHSLATTPGGDTLRSFYLEGLSVQEIALRNKEAVGTVTARLSRARKKLRETLLNKIRKSEESL